MLASVSINGDSSDSTSLYINPAPVVTPVVQNPEHPASVQWKPLLHQSLYLLAIMHGFRLATEPGTRDGLHNSVVGGYFAAVGNLHGYADGDPAYVNYLAHPLEGVVSSYIWIQNDPHYRSARFGRSRDYWMSRFRAYAFTWSFSEQFEIGPLSEASIGQIQRYYHQQGFVDHIITPNLGMAWVITEDALDELVVKRIEQSYTNKWLRLVLRTGLNPGQSLANVLAGHAPWHRDTRPGILSYALEPEGLVEVSQPQLTKTEREFPKYSRFDLTPLAESLRTAGKTCIGGGAIGAYRLSDAWQWTAEVGGCSFTNLPKNWNGDSLIFITGPQWTLVTSTRLNWHLHGRMGGQKITQEYIDPAKKKLAMALPSLGPTDDPNLRYAMYGREYDATGLAMSVGGGLEIGLNRAIGLQVANLEYVHSWLAPLNGMRLNPGFRVSSGFTLHIGTW